MDGFKRQLLAALDIRERALGFSYLSAGFAYGALLANGINSTPLDFLAAGPFCIETSIAFIDNRQLRSLREEASPREYKNDIAKTNAQTLETFVDLYDASKAGMKKGATLAIVGGIAGYIVGSISR